MKISSIILSIMLCFFCLFGCVSSADPDKDVPSIPPTPWPPPNDEVIVDWDNSWPKSEELNDSTFANEKLIWQDEFNGSTLNESNWNYELGNGHNGWGNNEQQYYKKENTRVNGGKLQIMARYEKHGGFNYTSSRLTTSNKFSCKYGRIEAKIKMPSGAGLWPAFWMMPQSNVYGEWPRSGEIDIMEAVGRTPDRTSGAVHYGVPHNYKTNANKFTDVDGQPTTISDWHVYSAVWEPEVIKLFVDNENILTVRSNTWFSAAKPGENSSNKLAPYDQNFFIILNLAVGGTFDNGVMPETSSFGALMEIDYVRAYSL